LETLAIPGVVKLDLTIYGHLLRRVVTSWSWIKYVV